MYASRDFIALCRGLSHLFPCIDPEPGTRLAREFADLGSEEFLVLSPGSIVSLFSGKVSELAESDRKNFFVLPDLQEMEAAVLRAGVDIVSAIFEEQRHWAVTVKAEAGEKRFIHRDLCCAFALALQLSNSQSKENR